MTTQGEKRGDLVKRGRGGWHQAAHDGNKSQAGGMMSAILAVDWQAVAVVAQGRVIGGLKHVVELAVVVEPLGRVNLARPSVNSGRASVYGGKKSRLHAGALSRLSS